jgi:dienelactone hydrolase
MMNQITVHGQDGTFAAYIARPKTSPASAAVVLQELFWGERRHSQAL